jgi:fatty acid-binding protein DegV
VSRAADIKSLSIIYSTTPDEAETLAGRLGSVFPKEHIVISQLSSGLGAHAGPGMIFVAMMASVPGPAV